MLTQGVKSWTFHGSGDSTTPSSCAIKALAGLRVDRGLAQYQQKEERRRLTLLTQLSEQALFVRHAKRLLSKKVLEEIRAAVRSEVSVVVPLVPEHALDDCT